MHGRQRELSCVEDNIGGQDQGGCSWILENNYLQALLHLVKNLLQIKMPICEIQKTNTNIFS